MTVGPWGAEVNGVEVVDVWGFTGGILNAETFGEEAGGGIPKKVVGVGVVGVGALDGRWIADIGGNRDGPGIGT